MRMHALLPAAALLMLASAPLASQQPDRVAFGYEVYDGLDHMPCGTNVNQVGQGLVTAECGTAQANHSATANNTAAVLQTYAHVDAAGGALASGSDRRYSSVGAAYWFDVLQVTGADIPATVRMSINWSGTLFASMAENPMFAYAEASATYSFTIWNEFSGLPAATYTQAVQADAGSTPWGYGGAESKEVHDSQTLTAPVGPSGVISFAMYLRSDATIAPVEPLVNNEFVALSGSATSDFSHTGVLTGLEFFDASGQQMNDVSYSFQNNTQIVSDATVTPEPGSLALLAPGLVGVFGFSRRRSGSRRAES